MRHEHAGYSSSRPPPRESDRAGTDPPHLPAALEKSGARVFSMGVWGKKGVGHTIGWVGERGGGGSRPSCLAAGRGALHRCYSLFSGWGRQQSTAAVEEENLFFSQGTLQRGEKRKKPSEGVRAHTQVRRRGNGPHFCTCTHPDMRVVYVYTLCISVCYIIPLL